jgi:hypothetical protein
MRENERTKYSNEEKARKQEKRVKWKVKNNKNRNKQQNDPDQRITKYRVTDEIDVFLPTVKSATVPHSSRQQELQRLSVSPPG